MSFLKLMGSGETHSSYLSETEISVIVGVLKQMYLYLKIDFLVK